MRNRSQFGAARSPPPAHTRRSLKSRFDPLSISLPVGRASTPSRRDPDPLLGALPPPHGGLPESTREARGSGPLPHHHTQPPSPPAPGPSWDETGQRKANRRQIVRGNSCVLGRATPPLPPPPPPRPARHKALHVDSPQLRYDGGAQKGSCFQKSHSGLGEELEKRGSKACLRQGFGF